MPGNRTVYKDAIKKGHNAAWDAQWPKAVAEYRRALAEFPEDLSVRMNLAHALEESGQYESAQREYRYVADKQPDDPAPRVHVAEMHRKQDRASEAAAVYLTVAELYSKLKQTSKTIDAWNKVVELEPERTDVHQRLAEAFEQSGRRGRAAHEYMALARIFDARGDREKALVWARRASKIDSNSAEAAEFVRSHEQPATPESESPSPILQAEKQALSRLAETLLEAQTVAPPGADDDRRQSPTRSKLSQPEVDALIARAVDAQMRHQVSDAIEAYRRLLNAGVERPELKFNLGLLYFESMRYDDAVTFLTATVDDKSYGLASHFALGQCYRAQGQMDQAVGHFLQVTKIVDLNSVQREQADDLISVYEELADSYAAKGDRKRAEAFSLALEKFLTDKGWEDKIEEFRRHIENLRAEGDQVSLGEMVGIPEADRVLEALALAQEYVRRDKFWAASEECYRAIELAPNYLPGHVRLAEVLARAGRSVEAHSKYQTLGEICIARGDKARAEVFYRSALKIHADDVGGRARLIDLLMQQNRVDDALEQYLQLGDSQVRSGQFGKAAERFAEGVRLAERSSIANPTALTLRHRLAEALARHGDYKAALDAYKGIHQHLPDDERAHFYLVDLEFRIGQASDGMRDLEELLERYRSKGEPQKATTVLEALAQSYPKEGALADRLAQSYLAAGAVGKAIETLDSLGELYLSLGQKPAAAATIRQILALDPPRSDDYRKLLEQIGE